MTRKVYRTAQGKMVDIGALQLRNENIRAVGNMPVNARGDLIDHMNRPIEARTQQVAKSYRKQTTNVSDTSVYADTATDTKKNKKIRASKSAEEQTSDSISAAPSPAAPTAPQTAARPLTGLAAAIAKARQIKQEELSSPQQVAEHQRRNREG